MRLITQAPVTPVLLQEDGGDRRIHGGVQASQLETTAKQQQKHPISNRVGTNTGD